MPPIYQQRTRWHSRWWCIYLHHYIHRHIYIYMKAHLCLVLLLWIYDYYSISRGPSTPICFHHRQNRKVSPLCCAINRQSANCSVSFFVCAVLSTVICQFLITEPRGCPLTGSMVMSQSWNQGSWVWNRSCNIPALTYIY